MLIFAQKTHLAAAKTVFFEQISTFHVQLSLNEYFAADKTVFLS